MMMIGRLKKTAGAEYERRRNEKQAEVKKITHSITSFLTKGNVR